MSSHPSSHPMMTRSKVKVLDDKKTYVDFLKSKSKSGMINFIKDKLFAMLNEHDSNRKIEIYFEIFDTIIANEKTCSDKNDVLFKKNKFYNALLKKIDELDDYLNTFKIHIEHLQVIKENMKELGSKRML